MRDPERIPRILIKLQTVWEQNPDLRLGQLLEVIHSTTTVEAEALVDPFFRGDGVMEMQMDSALNGTHPHWALKGGATKMRKIVINISPAGFGISRRGVVWLQEHNHPKTLDIDLRRSYQPDDGFNMLDLMRDDPLLVQMVEELGDESGDYYWAAGALSANPQAPRSLLPRAKLRIVEVPDGVEWHVVEDGGCEWVAEKHRTWHYDREGDVYSGNCPICDEIEANTEEFADGCILDD